MGVQQELGARFDEDIERWSAYSDAFREQYDSNVEEYRTEEDNGAAVGSEVAQLAFDHADLEVALPNGVEDYDDADVRDALGDTEEEVAETADQDADLAQEDESGDDRPEETVDDLPGPRELTA